MSMFVQASWSSANSEPINFKCFATLPGGVLDLRDRAKQCNHSATKGGDPANYPDSQGRNGHPDVRFLRGSLAAWNGFFLHLMLFLWSVVRIGCGSCGIEVLVFMRFGLIMPARVGSIAGFSEQLPGARMTRTPHKEEVKVHPQ